MQGAETFQQLYQRACERKGGPEKLESMMGSPLSAEELKALGDDRYLAAFTMKVFQSGFVWRVVRDKWPDFEEVFFGFDIEKVLLIHDELLEQKAQDPRIIRNYNKVKTIRDNAIMIDDIRGQHGSFANFVADWPGDNIVGLWDYLKKHGARLGGNTGPYGLRAIGKDTFCLGNDVVGYFQQRDIISGSATSKRSLTAIQECFNNWAAESGRALQQISQIVAFGVGDNFVQADSVD